MPNEGRYEAKGRNSGNGHNGHYIRKVRSSGGDTEIKVPRDRNGKFQPPLLKKTVMGSNERPHPELAVDPQRWYKMAAN